MEQHNNPYAPAQTPENATLGELLQTATDKASQAANDLRSTDVGAVIDDTKQRAAETVETVKAKAGELGDQASAKADDAMTAAGDQLKNVAQTIVEHAPEGKAGELAVNAADALDRGGNYLRDADVAKVRSDLETIIRDHPIEALAVGLGVGFLLARATRR